MGGNDFSSFFSSASKLVSILSDGIPGFPIRLAGSPNFLLCVHPVLHSPVLFLPHATSVDGVGSLTSLGLKTPSEVLSTYSVMYMWVEIAQMFWCNVQRHFCLVMNDQ